MNALDEFDDNPDKALQPGDWVDDITIGTHIVRKQPIHKIAYISHLDLGIPGMPLYYVTYPECSNWVSADSLRQNFEPAS